MPGWISTSVLGLLVMMPGGVGLPAEELPSAAVILQQLLDRAQSTPNDSSLLAYTYQKRAWFAEYNSKGQCQKSIERIYRVRVEQGHAEEQLIQMRSSNLSENEIRKELNKEQEFITRLAGQHPEEKEQRQESWITPELLARFEFVVETRECLHGHPVFRLAFYPGSASSPDKSIPDRILNRLAGRVWISEQESEIVRLEARLIHGLSLGWLGLVGSLSQCSLVVERQRLNPGNWVKVRHELRVTGRKFLSAISLRLAEACEEFKFP